MSVASLALVDRGIPRRLSALSSERFFDLGMVARCHDRVEVTIDGRVVGEVTSWDVDAGEIVRPKRNGDGSMVCDERGTPTFERLRGHVEVHWLKGQAPPPADTGAA